MATTPALTSPFAHSVIPMPAVPTSSIALSADSVLMNRVMSRICAAMACACSSITSRTYASSSLARAKSLTVRMLV